MLYDILSRKKGTIAIFGSIVLVLAIGVSVALASTSDHDPPL